MANVKSIDYIVSAKHYGGSGKKYLKDQQEKFRRAGTTVNLHGIDDPSGDPVKAFIHQGQWVAQCEDCNGASFIDPDEPVFFCFGCGNRRNGGNCRPVEVPANWREIEQVLLERPVEDVAGLTDNERVGMARPVLYIETEFGVELPLARSWKPHETLDDLHGQQDAAIGKWREKKDKVKNGI